MLACQRFKKSKRPSARCQILIFTSSRGRSNEMEAERFDRALEVAAQSGKLDRWLEKVDADIDAGRVKPLDEIIDNS